MKTRRIKVTSRGGNLFFQPQCGSLCIGPIRRLPDSASSSQVGETALATFEDCKPEGAVPWPKDWAAFGEPTLRAMGVANWDELMVGASMVFLDLEGDRLFVNPSRTCPDGFFPVAREKQVVVPAGSSPEVIGDAIESAFSKCVEGPPPERLPPLEPEE